MTPEGLRKLIAQGESLGVEFKGEERARSRTRSLLGGRPRETGDRPNKWAVAHFGPEGARFRTAAVGREQRQAERDDQEQAEGQAIAGEAEGCMIPKDCKRLAEVDLPIADVSRHAAREKSIRHGHPSTLSISGGRAGRLHRAVRFFWAKSVISARGKVGSSRGQSLGASLNRSSKIRHGE